MTDAARSSEADPTIYPAEERVGEDIVQRWIVELLRPLIERWYAERGETAFVGADQFIYYEQFNSTARVAPDVYVLPGVAPDERVTAWKVWEKGISPSFALEVVSSDWRKDYEDAPGRHEAAGTRELVVFDPWWTERPGGDGLRWQCFRGGGKGLTRIEANDGDRIRVDTLDCWLRCIGEERQQRLRLATGPTGDTVFPTAEEAALARIADLEARLRERGG